MSFLDTCQISTIAPLKYHESSLQYHHNYHGNTTVLIWEGKEFGFTLPFKSLGSLRFFYVSERSLFCSQIMHLFDQK